MAVPYNIKIENDPEVCLKRWQHAEDDRLQIKQVMREKPEQYDNFLPELNSAIRRKKEAAAQYKTLTGEVLENFSFRDWLDDLQEFRLTTKAREQMALEKSIKDSKKEGSAKKRECPICHDFPCTCGHISPKQWSKRKGLTNND